MKTKPEYLSAQFVEECQLVARYARENPEAYPPGSADALDNLARDPSVKNCARADSKIEIALKLIHDRIGFRINLNIGELWVARVLIRDLARAGYLRLFDYDRAAHRAVVPFRVDDEHFEIPWPVASVDDSTRENLTAVFGNNNERTAQ